MVPVPVPTTGPEEIEEYLDAHNEIRADHGAEPLVWSTELQAKAQSWASGCQFRHSDGALGLVGENLVAGTKVFTPSDAVAQFVDEDCKLFSTLILERVLNSSFQMILSTLRSITSRR